MASVGGTIQASDFNAIQSKIEKVLGQSQTSDPQFGYGQAINSNPVTALTDRSVPNGTSATAENTDNLLNEIKTLHKHQTGNDLNIASFQVGDIIGANASGTDMIYDSAGSRTIANRDNDKGINDLNSIADTLLANRLDVAASQTSTAVVFTDTRNRDWNETIFSEFTVSFTSAAERRHFFNSGGRIEIEGDTISGTSTGISGPRDDGWRDMLTNVGKVVFDRDNTVDLGNASGVSKPNGNIGNFSVSSSYQTILRKDPGSGLYENSFWTVEAKENSASELSFRVTLVDAGPEGGADAINEPITVDISFTYGYRKADGAVVAPTPAFSLVEDLNLDQNTEAFVATPNNSSPGNNQVVGTNLDVTLSASAFNVVNGSDTHEATQWYVKKAGSSTATLYEEDSSGTTSKTVPRSYFDDVRGTNQDYEWQVRYKGANLGWSPWSSATRFTASQYARFNIVISSDIEDYDLFTAIQDNAGWNGSQRVSGTVTVASGVVVGARTTNTYAFTVDNIPSGSNVTLQNNGRITGMGGNGGFFTSSGNPVSGANGGPALRTTANITIQNSNGVIAGGGGGGGSGHGRETYRVYANNEDPDGTQVTKDGYASGGGGAGFYTGNGGDTLTGNNIISGYGGNGTVTSGGGPGTSSTTQGIIAQGGSGGNPGQSGATGSGNIATSSGGSAGNAIEGISNVSFASGSGNVLGPTT